MSHTFHPPTHPNICGCLTEVAAREDSSALNSHEWYYPYYLSSTILAGTHGKVKLSFKFCFFHSSSWVKSSPTNRAAVDWWVCIYTWVKAICTEPTKNRNLVTSANMFLQNSVAWKRSVIDELFCLYCQGSCTLFVHEAILRVHTRTHTPHMHTTLEYLITILR